ncbi:MAG: hypothetical protein LBV12_01075 [Puniceicoccales bacterium]|jgi:hypothetical protein|nr:hypothetical protein [Puniceicoccales bacterium]
MNLRSSAFFLVPVLSFVGVSHSTAYGATVSNYDFGVNVGVANTVLSTDGWKWGTGSSGDLSKWITSSSGSILYARNNNIVSDYSTHYTLVRLNDAGFGYSIISSDTSVEINFSARSNGNANGTYASGIVFGLTDTSGNILFGVGGGRGTGTNKNAYYSETNAGVNYYSVSGNAYGDTNNGIFSYTVSLDLINNSASFSREGSLLQDNIDISNVDFTTAGGIYVGGNSQYSGIGPIQISVIPEPSTYTMGALGVIGALMLVRRRFRK